jgi:hypothetical protein
MSKLPSNPIKKAVVGGAMQVQNMNRNRSLAGKANPLTAARNFVQGAMNPKAAASSMAMHQQQKADQLKSDRNMLSKVKAGTANLDPTAKTNIMNAQKRVDKADAKLGKKN